MREEPNESPLALHERYMHEAIRLARVARDAGEVPVGAVALRGGQIIGRGWNRTVTESDPTVHAEMIALREAARAVGDWRLVDITLYVTLEPCAMCAGAIVIARVKQVVFGAWDEKVGMAGSVGDLLRHPRLNHRPQVTGGVLANECGTLIADFFAARRAVSSSDRG